MSAKLQISQRSFSESQRRVDSFFLQRCNACYYAIKAIACVSRGSTCLLFHVEKTPKKTVAAADKTELIDFLFIFS